MNELLEKAIDKIRALPDAEQNAVAALMLEEFPDEEQRDRAFARSQTRLAWMREKARLANRPEPPEILKHADWEVTPENAERICEHIKDLIESSRVLEARRVVAAIRPGISAELDYWKKVLAEPVGRVRKPTTDRDTGKDILWIEENADRYKGKWVALKSGELLGSYESLKDLHHTLKKSGRLAGILAFQVGD